MSSIRVWLTVCFLLLLTVALVTDSLLVYRNAQQTLESKEAAIAQLILTQYRERRREEEAHFDDALLLQARTLARMVYLEPDLAQVTRRESHRFALLSTSMAPCGYLLAPSWIMASVPSPLFFELYRKMRTEIRLYDTKLTEEPRTLIDGQPGDYFQISGPSSSIILSSSMGGRSFPLDMQAFGAEHVVHWAFDDLTFMKTDSSQPLHLRRVVLKAAAPRRPHFHLDQLPEIPGPGNEGHLQHHLPGVLGAPSIFVQYAMETQARNTAIASYETRRDEELKLLGERTETELMLLRHRLLGMSVLIFLAAAVGSLLLVWVGLAPLRRLGEAVSHVTSSDFSLPFQEEPLAAELRPIVGALQRTLAELARAFAREKQAAADMSHELRTPLAALMTTIEFALRKPRTTADYQEVLQDCRQTVQHMHQAIERLLTLARLDAGVDKLRPQLVDVGTLGDQCASIVRSLAEARGVVLTVQRKGQTVIFSDPDKLREVLNNLLHNAIEYNKPGGLIELTIQGEADRVRVSVRDTGIGIPAHARDHIFERFYRADFARSGDGMHTGLGLPIVQHYVQLMGGTISVESVEGEGSTFWLELPRKT